MPSARLTDQQCKAAKPREKPYKLFDGDGMFLAVSPAGGKVWRLQYRLAGKQQTLTIGDYPRISLKDARAKAQEARGAISEGRRPAPKRGALTLAQASEQYWTARQDIGDQYRMDALNALRAHVFSEVGAMPIGNIRDDHLLGPLMALDRAGKPAYAAKVRVWLCQVFDWAVATKQATGNPARSIKPEHAFTKRKVQHFASLPLTQMGDLMRGLRGLEPTVGPLACRFLALTWTRTKEVRGMRWSEVNGDLWTIPKERMKRDKAHVVPLSTQAREVLNIMRVFSRSDLVFAPDSAGEKLLSEGGILAVLYRLGYRGKMTGHGFRSMASTWANERQYPADAIERQLSHSPEDETRATYNHAEYLPIRSAMLQDWADWIDVQAEERLPAPALADATTPLVASEPCLASGTSPT